MLGQRQLTLLVWDSGPGIPERQAASEGPRSVESVEDLDLLGRVRQGLLDL